MTKIKNWYARAGVWLQIAVILGGLAVCLLTIGRWTSKIEMRLSNLEEKVDQLLVHRLIPRSLAERSD